MFPCPILVGFVLEYFWILVLHDSELETRSLVAISRSVAWCSTIRHAFGVRMLLAALCAFIDEKTSSPNFSAKRSRFWVAEAMHCGWDLAKPNTLPFRSSVLYATSRNCKHYHQLSDETSSGITIVLLPVIRCHIGVSTLVDGWLFFLLSQSETRGC